MTEAASDLGDEQLAATVRDTSISPGQAVLSGFRQPVVAVLLLIALCTAISGRPFDGVLMVTVAALLVFDAARTRMGGVTPDAAGLLAGGEYPVVSPGMPGMPTMPGEGGSRGHDAHGRVAPRLAARPDVGGPGRCRGGRALCRVRGIVQKVFLARHHRRRGSTARIAAAPGRPAPDGPAAAPMCRYSWRRWHCRSRRCGCPSDCLRSAGSSPRSCGRGRGRVGILVAWAWLGLHFFAK
ncbi:MAG: hypothetical protein WBH47_09875 [Streptosporangiaceae bacterium]